MGKGQDGKRGTQPIKNMTTPYPPRTLLYIHLCVLTLLYYVGGACGLSLVLYDLMRLCAVLFLGVVNVWGTRDHIINQ